MKKKISVLLIAVMALSLVLAGCGGDKGTADGGMDKVKAGFIYTVRLTTAVIRKYMTRVVWRLSML